MKKLILISLLATLLTGCCNLVYRSQFDSSHMAYTSTVYVGIKLGDAMFGPWNDSYMRRREHYEAQFMFPWLLVDLPCEAVVDTLFLPIDILRD